MIKKSYRFIPAAILSAGLIMVQAGCATITVGGGATEAVTTASPVTGAVGTRLTTSSDSSASVVLTSTDQTVQTVGETTGETVASTSGRPTLSAAKQPAQAPLQAESYFADALFIGDSRTEGLQLYGTLYDADFVCQKGLSVGKYFDEVIPINKQEQTAASYIERNRGRYKAVYIAFGINETGWPLENFIAAYTEVINHVIKNQPQATVYVQTILPVERSQDSNEYVNNAMINKFNVRIDQMAAELKVYLIDPATAVMNKDGIIDDDMTQDGIHFGRKLVLQWQNYIQTHVVTQ